MHRVIDISLTGHPEPFRVHDDAYELLRQYLDRARAGLADDPDAAEVVGDLERSIGEKLAAQRSDGPLLDANDIRTVLEEVGAVGEDDPAPPPVVPVPAAAPSSGRRRLYRIREGQQLAGVCAGLAEYAELDVSLVRWVFVLLALVTAGIFLMGYVVAMFILPVVPTREAFAAAQVVPNGAP